MRQAELEFFYRVTKQEPSIDVTLNFGYFPSQVRLD